MKNSNELNDSARLIIYHDAESSRTIKYLVRDGEVIASTNNDDETPILKNRTKYSWRELEDCNIYYFKTEGVVTILVADNRFSDPESNLSDRMVMINNDLLRDFEVNDLGIRFNLVNRSGISRKSLDEYVNRLNPRIKSRLLMIILGNKTK